MLCDPWSSQSITMVLFGRVWPRVKGYWSWAPEKNLWIHFLLEKCVSWVTQYDGYLLHFCLFQVDVGCKTINVYDLRYKDNPFECPEIIAAVVLALIFFLILTIVIVVCRLRKRKQVKKADANPVNEGTGNDSSAAPVPSRYLHPPEESYEVNIYAWLPCYWLFLIKPSNFTLTMPLILTDLLTVIIDS